MPRIRCHYDDCVFLEEGHCGAAAVELEPETGCLTFSQADAPEAEEEWDELEEDELDEDEEELYEDEDEDDDLWDDDEEDDEY
jgi:hypothetical protein